jgi:hypothetical protein
LRRIILLVTVAAMMAAMMAVAGPAFATVHPLSNAECSEAPEGTGGFVAAELQDPPGLTPGGLDKSKAQIAQPIISVLEAQGPDSKAFKQDPTPGSELFCPANK